jgi:hypothetical protein
MTVIWLTGEPVARFDALFPACSIKNAVPFKKPEKSSYLS